MVSLAYREGDWFAIPLRGGGFAVGVVARMNPSGVLLGYFFGPKREAPPELEELCELKADDAVLVRKFGHLGLQKKRWPLIGRLDGWRREDWPMPAFIRFEELSGKSHRVVYDDDDPSRVLREELVAPGVSEQGPQDGLMGSGFAERALTALLGSET